MQSENADLTKYRMVQWLPDTGAEKGHGGWEVAGERVHTVKIHKVNVCPHSITSNCS